MVKNQPTTEKRLVVAQIEQAEADRTRKMAELEARCSSLREEISMAAKDMEAATSADDLEAYREAWSRKMFNESLLDTHEQQLDQLKNGPLFGQDTDAMIKALQAELGQIEREAMRKIIPLLDQAREIAEQSRGEFLALSGMLPTILARTGRTNVPYPVPECAAGFLQLTGRYADPTIRSKWGL